jgi:predicted RNase H-like HicB family nuclease
LANVEAADGDRETLQLTIVYEDAGDGDGWVVARIPQVRGAISQGANRAEARENVIDALREILAFRFGTPPEHVNPADSEPLELTIAA